MRVLLAMLVLVALPAVAEEIYRTTDEDGNVVFTDQPPSDDAEPVELDPLTTVPAREPEMPATGDDTEPDAQQAAPVRGYEGVRIAYPPADQAVRHNGGNVPVRLELLPEGAELAEGHTALIVVDGGEHDAGRATEITVGPLERGPHRVRARILDRTGRVVAESSSTRFMLLRAALGDRAQGQQGGQSGNQGGQTGGQGGSP